MTGEPWSPRTMHAYCWAGGRRVSLIYTCSPPPTRYLRPQQSLQRRAADTEIPRESSDYTCCPSAVNDIYRGLGRQRTTPYRSTQPSAGMAKPHTHPHQRHRGSDRDLHGPSRQDATRPQHQASGTGSASCSSDVVGQGRGPAAPRSPSISSEPGASHNIVQPPQHRPARCTPILQGAHSTGNRARCRAVLIPPSRVLEFSSKSCHYYSAHETAGFNPPRSFHHCPPPSLPPWLSIDVT